MRRAHDQIARGKPLEVPIPVGVDATRAEAALLQGDVGAGKTIVAALAACQAISAGWQAAFIVTGALMSPAMIANSTAVSRSFSSSGRGRTHILTSASPWLPVRKCAEVVSIRMSQP